MDFVDEDGGSSLRALDTTWQAGEHQCEYDQQAAQSPQAS
jgi:hypothetical protein